MLIRFFRSSQPGLLFVIPVLALVWFIPFVFNPTESFVEIPEHAMPLYEWLAATITKLPFIAQLSVSWILMSIQAIYLNQLIIKHEVFPRISFLPALFFITLHALFPEMLKIQPAMFVNLILLIVLGKIFSMYKNPEPLSGIFDCSVLLAVAVLLHSSSLAFYFFLLLSLAILLPFHWRNWIASLIGFALPFYFISVYFFWIDRLGIFWNLKFPAAFSFIHLLPAHFSGWQIALMIIVMMLLLFSILSVAKHFYKNVIRTRKYFKLTFTLLVIGALSLLFTANFSVQSIASVLIPLSVLLAYYFLQIKKNALAEFFFTVLIGLIIIVRLV